MVMRDIPLLGYGDRLSGRPGERIEFKVSSTLPGDVEARLFRSICADPNPAGPGIIEEACPRLFATMAFPGRHQSFRPGSFGLGKGPLALAPDRGTAFSALIWPTMDCDHDQTILSLGPWVLAVRPGGVPVFRCGRGEVAAPKPLSLRCWQHISGTLSADGVMRIAHGPVGGAGGAEGKTEHAAPHPDADADTDAQPIMPPSARPCVAARMTEDGAVDFFNGKIEGPRIEQDGSPVAVWDFSRDIPTTTARAVTGPDMDLINFPTRGMTGASWDGSEMCWRHRPEHYGAIHFHEDDIYDFGWETDFTLTIPEDMPSGVYVMRLRAGEHEDAIPFFVCAPRGKPRAALCVLASTFTYAIYGNHARIDYDPAWQRRNEAWNAYPHNPATYPQYGLSTYNNHRDGSGICHASHRRPLFSLRPGYLTFGAAACSGLRHFQADSHLIAWLHAKGIDYDVITDHELNHEGVEALAGYKAVTTGTHPEYHTGEMLDALTAYRDGGGRLLYLGGNGFYWRIAIHREHDGLLEIRRAEGGIRSWASEPGEYYQAFDGCYGGLWRRNGRPPQQLAGIGFIAQGTFDAGPYRRCCNDPDYAWIFEGVAGEVIGDYGFSGCGAAGFELDHWDHRLGTPKNAVLLARSEAPEGKFMLVPEEQLTHLANLTGKPAEEILHADMIWFDVPGGGFVFATGSITFCGSLPWNDFDNDISRILENVMTRALR